jgi:hypothetical protein
MSVPMVPSRKESDVVTGLRIEESIAAKFHSPLDGDGDTLILDGEFGADRSDSPYSDDFFRPSLDRYFDTPNTKYQIPNTKYGI